MTKQIHSLAFAVFVGLGLLFVFFGVQVLAFAIVNAFVVGTQGFKVALATLVGGVAMSWASYALAGVFGDAKTILALHKFYKKHLTGSLGLLVMFVLATTLLENYYQNSPMDFMNVLLDESSFWLFVLLVVVVAPIYEELVFRGFLMGVVLRAKSTLSIKQRWLFATVFSSLAFTAIHLQYDWFGLGLIFVLSLIFSWARLVSGSVFLPMVLHFLNNSLAMVVYLLS